MQRAHRASIEFSLNWQSHYGKHKDRYLVRKVGFLRDIFPENMKQRISTLQKDESCKENFGAGELVPPLEQNKIREFEDTQFERNQGGSAVTPLLGRFYPQGFAWRVFNCHRVNIIPFKIINIDNGVLVADTNHPLASYPLTLGATCIKKLGSIEERGGQCNDIPEMVTGSGPGMQIPYPGISTDFYSTYPFQRRNEDDDTIFYLSPRLINHLDDMAISQVKSIYAKLLDSGSKMLDLMSSWVSHLPDTLKDYEATGLGLNKEELRANQQLSKYVVHDLNQRPMLPFADNEYDAVICTASIEYLIQPIEVITDIARVTKPGGIFVSVFSDRWFPGKEILPWSEMHHFERLGLVLDYYIKTDAFENLHTESVRGLPRPLDDIHIGETVTSDPIFAVWGSVKS